MGRHKFELKKRRVEWILKEKILNLSSRKIQGEIKNLKTEDKGKFK